MADINISIIDATQVATVQGFGITLILTTNQEFAYKKYDITDGLANVTTDFAGTTAVYKKIAAIAAQNPKPQFVSVFGKVCNSGADVKTALDALLYEESEWYRIVTDSTTEDVIKGIADWVLANNRMFYSASIDLYATDFSASSRMVGIIEGSIEKNMDAALAGYNSTRIPGTFTDNAKTLLGVTTDKLPARKVIDLKAKNYNYYPWMYGLPWFSEGKTMDGKYIDSIESKDYIRNDMTQRIATALASADKIPYTNTGIQQIVAIVTASLDNAAALGIITDRVVNYKTIEQIPATDRAARKLTGITFEYVESGAIHKVDVIGKVVTGIVTANL